MSDDETGSPPSRRSRRPRMTPEAVNSIEPASTARERAVPPSPPAAPSQGAAVAPSDPPAKADGVRGFTAVPEAVLDRYYRIRNEFFLDNGELAFVNHGERLTTRSENAEIVGDLVRIAHHNGYAAITVTGTERFRREAWAQATRLGMEVQGYQPTEHDKKQWVRSLSREEPRTRTPAEREVREPTPTADAKPVAAAVLAAESVRESQAPARPQEGRGPQDGEGPRTYFGELIEHGEDHYQHNPREERSYFVKLHGSRGELELWGLDLKRALAESKSNPRVGDQIGILQTGHKPVTVKSRLFDETGQFLGEQDKAAHRNRWQIEKREFFDERAQLAHVLRDPRVSAQEGTQRHPQLVGTYFVLKEAQVFAKQAYRSDAERESFLSLMRERLAQEIERGEALRTTQIRDHRQIPQQEIDTGEEARRRQGPRGPRDPERSR